MSTPNFGFPLYTRNDSSALAAKLNAISNAGEAAASKVVNDRNTADNAVWTQDTPLWQAGGTLSVGDGQLFRRWRKDGRTVEGQISLIRAANTNIGSGFWTFNLPVAARSYREVYGGGFVAVGTTYYGITVVGVSTGFIGFAFTQTGARAGSGGHPGGAWAAGNDLLLWFNYEAA